MKLQHNHPARKLYHLTKFDYGNEMAWYPKDTGTNRTESEPKIPRICFSLSVAGCFVSLGYIATHYKSWHLYSTLGEYYSPSVDDVFDARVSQEVWRLQPTLLKKEHDFSEDERAKIQNHLYFMAGNPSALRHQLKFKPRINQTIQYIFNAKA